MVTPIKKLLRWFFLCDVSLKAETGSGVRSKSTDRTSDRWRLLCWTFLCTCFWNRFEPSLVNFLTILCSLALLFLVVQYLTYDPVTSPVSVKGVLVILLILAVLNGVTVVTSYSGHYLSYEYLVKKIILKEYHLFHFWCPTVYMVLTSVTGLTLVSRHLLARLGRTLGQKLM